MLTRLGNVIYCAGCIVAMLWIYVAITQGNAGLWLSLAVASVACGWAIRYVLCGRIYLFW